MKQLLKLYKSKTIIFFTFLATAGILQDSVNYLQPFLSPEDYGKAVAIVGLIGVILRVVTTTSLSEKVSKWASGINNSIACKQTTTLYMKPTV